MAQAQTQPNAQTDIREKIMEFEQQRQSLMNVGMQKQQLQSSVSGLEKALDELSRSKEEKVYKAVGNILILRDAKEVAKELEELKETQSLRLKTMDKQEKNLMEKLTSLKSQIELEAANNPQGGAPSPQVRAPAPKGGDATVISSKKKAE